MSFMLEKLTFRPKTVDNYGDFGYKTGLLDTLSIKKRL